MSDKKTKMKRKMTSASHPFRFKSEWERLAWNHKFSAHDTLVLQYLIFMANTGDGDDCYPSVRRIAAYTRLSERAVQRSLSSLEGQRVIVRNKRIGYTNLYEFCDPTGFTTELVNFEARQYPGHESRPKREEGCHTVTPDCVAGEGCPTVTGGVTNSHRGGATQSPYQYHRPESSTQISDQEAAATRAHEGERTHEARQPAAAAPAGQDDFGHQKPKQAAAAASREGAQTSTAAPQRVAASVEGDGLASWLVGELKARKAELVRTDAPATPAQVKVCVAAVVALADGDEVEARQYLEDRLTYYKLRGEGRPKSLSTLLGFLADRGDFEKWASAPPAAPAPKKVKNQFARDPDDVPRPPVKNDPEDVRKLAAMFGVVLPAVPVARNGEGVNHEN